MELERKPIAERMVVKSTSRVLRTEYGLGIPKIFFLYLEQQKRGRLEHQNGESSSSQMAIEITYSTVRK